MTHGNNRILGSHVSLQDAILAVDKTPYFLELEKKVNKLENEIEQLKRLIMVQQVLFDDKEHGSL